MKLSNQIVKQMDFASDEHSVVRFYQLLSIFTHALYTFLTGGLRESIRVAPTGIRFRVEVFWFRVVIRFFKTFLSVSGQWKFLGSGLGRISS